MAKPQGFPKTLRLRSQKEIARVFRRGRYHRLGVLQAKTLPALGQEPRFMISVKKSVGSAPERNRIKRLVREAIRLNVRKLNHPFDVCLFLTTPPPSRVGLAMIESELRRLFDRVTQSQHEDRGER